MKNELLNNGIEIVNLDARHARVRLVAEAGEITASEKLASRIQAVSQWGIPVKITNAAGTSDNFNYERAADILPTPDDYITVPFRAISKSVVPGHWIDWSKDNVLKDSLQKLYGQTVYPNHDFTDVTQWLGSVASVEWDEAGEQSDGVPGINAEYKIDALMNPRIARGLLMDPPAIHSTSMTVLFKYEYSHPDIAADNRWRFFDLLGEEVEGEIVRLIVTEILEYWEASLVFQGADRLAKQRKETKDFAEMAADTGDDASPLELKTGAKTMKLTAEQKTKLGIESDGDEISETEIASAAERLADRLESFGEFDPSKIAELTAAAEAGKAFIEKQRGGVVRLAKIAEISGDSEELPAVIAKQIAAADFETLVELEAYYTKKAVDKFPAGGRSSVETSDAVESAGGVKQQTSAPRVGLH